MRLARRNRARLHSGCSAFFWSDYSAAQKTGSEARPSCWPAKAPAPQSGIAATKTGPTRAAAADQGGPPHKSSQAAKIFRSSSTLAFFHIPWRARLQFEPDRLAPPFGDEARASARGRGGGGGEGERERDEQ